ncbi:hypothetical protein [Nocardia brasiliensis]|uniref:hypothetical protein n=1 Tax=Nocardia brasiliensis TaxID=37326 RepID=UPI00366CFCF7
MRRFLAAVPLALAMALIHQAPSAVAEETGWPQHGKPFQLESLDPQHKNQCITIQRDEVDRHNIMVVRACAEPGTSAIQAQTLRAIDPGKTSRIKNDKAGGCLYIEHVLSCAETDAQKWTYDPTTKQASTKTATGSVECWMPVGEGLTIYPCTKKNAAKKLRWEIRPLD